MSWVSVGVFALLVAGLAAPQPPTTQAPTPTPTRSTAPAPTTMPTLLVAGPRERAIFLDVLRQFGLSRGGDRADLDRGQRVCSMFDDGASEEKAASALVAAGDYSDIDATAFVAASAVALCPQHLEKISP